MVPSRGTERLGLLSVWNSYRQRTVRGGADSMIRQPQEIPALDS